MTHYNTCDDFGTSSPSSAPEVGLSSSTYLSGERAEFIAEFAAGGTQVRCGPAVRPVSKISRAPRGKVRGFSERSRKRLRNKLGRYSRDELAKSLFVTLTYPASYPSPEVCKAQFQAFCKRLLRAFPAAGICWKEELQRRGAPHFHLLVMGVPFIKHQTVARWWYEIVGSGDPRHLAAGTQVKRVKSYAQARSYTEKYLGKVEQNAGEGEQLGRVWGFKGAHQRYLATMVLVGMSRPQYAKLLRVLCGLRRGEIRRARSPSRGVIRWSKRRLPICGRVFRFAVPCSDLLRNLETLLGPVHWY